MREHHQITVPGKLLDLDGYVREPGYAKQPLLQYCRSDVKAPKWRIKEWDYYLITDGKRAVALTVADNSYMGLLSVSFLDLENPLNRTKTAMKMFPSKKSFVDLPETSSVGDVRAKHGGIEIEYLHTETGRKISCKAKDFYGGHDFWAEFVIDDIPPECMVIATPFTKKRHFYYNQKINCMRAAGKAVLGGVEYEFKQSDSTAILDWGRGVWPYDNTWYWGTASGYLKGKKFGFNIGYGFGDTSAASENMIFYDGAAHKFDDVDFGIPKNSKGKYEFLRTWHTTSSDNRLDFIFEPILDRRADTSLLNIIASYQHQVFGKATGYAVLDDGTKLQFKDLLASAEVIHNKW